METCWICGDEHPCGPYHLDGCPHCSFACDPLLRQWALDRESPRPQFIPGTPETPHARLVRRLIANGIPARFT
jgi:hypothetical protein